MAKYNLRLLARGMRSNGESVKSIAKKLNISTSTSSLWTRDIPITLKQQDLLRQNRIESGEKGRLKGSLMQKNRRIEKQNRFLKEGVSHFQKINDKELLTAGIALYWAEGSKKSRAVQLCNSDPKMISFFIKWLNKFFYVSTKRLSARVQINEIHKNRELDIKKFWSKYTGIPLNQFRKTMFKKSKLKKVYENYNKYFGVLDIYVLKPNDIYYKILGLVEGLAGVAQR